MNHQPPELNSFVLQYTDQTHDSFLTDLSMQLGISNQNGVLTIPDFVGSGSISNHKLEEGFYLRSLDFKLNFDFNIHRKIPEPGEKYFHIYYFLDKTDFQFALDNDSIRQDTFGNMIFMSNDIEIKGTFRGGSHVKAIILLFTSEWMEKACIQMDEQLEQYFRDLKKNNEASFLLSPIHTYEYDKAHQVLNKISLRKNICLQTRVNCLNLIIDFFKSLNTRNYLESGKTKSSYFLEIVKVEHRLIEYLKTTLPPIKELAKEFNLSESTLKRHFKVVFGKNIYEYYLEKKMNLARDMILKEKLPVAEVAYTLGYEKASSLTTGFKKIFKILPSKLKV